jgi:hypothetical protein
MAETMTTRKPPAPFGWKVRELMMDRVVEAVEDLGLSAKGG